MYYKLNEDKSVSPCTPEESFTNPAIVNYIIKRSIVYGKHFISTVFFGTFETVVFIVDENFKEIYRTSYPTYDDALKGHEAAIQLVKNGCPEL
jgi:hypothetical protein